jgi:hypothetical protein
LVSGARLGNGVRPRGHQFLASFVTEHWFEAAVYAPLRRDFFP